MGFGPSRIRLSRRPTSEIAELRQLDDLTEVSEEIRSRAELVEEHFAHIKHSSWSAVFEHLGMIHAQTQMSGYYGRLAIVAALLGGSTLSANSWVNPNFADPEHAWFELQAKPESVAIGITSAMCFALFFVTVMDCLLIELSLKQIPDDKFFLHFISSQGLLLNLPTVSFTAGLCFAFVNFAVSLKLIYGLTVGLVGTGLCLIGLLGMGHRYYVLSKDWSLYAVENHKQAVKRKGNKVADSSSIHDTAKPSG